MIIPLLLLSACDKPESESETVCLDPVQEDLHPVNLINRFDERVTDRYTVGDYSDMYSGTGQEIYFSKKYVLDAENSGHLFLRDVSVEVKKSQFEAKASAKAEVSDSCRISESSCPVTCDDGSTEQCDISYNDRECVSEDVDKKSSSKSISDGANTKMVFTFGYDNDQSCRLVINRSAELYSKNVNWGYCYEQTVDTDGEVIETSEIDSYDCPELYPVQYALNLIVDESLK